MVTLTLKILQDFAKSSSVLCCFVNETSVSLGKLKFVL